MKNNLWIIALIVVAAAAVLLAAWHLLGLGQADDAIVTAGAMGWIALALVGFGALAAGDPFRSRA